MHASSRFLMLAAAAALGLGEPAYASGQDAILLAQNDGEAKPGRTVTIREDSGEFVGVEDYWLGVSCTPLSDDLRDELKLGEEQGLVVVDVVPDSPAAKADLQKNDVLLAAADDLLAKPRDLQKAVRKVKEKELKLKLIRDGKRKEITIKPERHVSGKGGLEFGGEPFNVRIFRPGHMLPPRVAIRLKRRELPDDMTVHIVKHGKEPAKISVTQGDKSWEATEDTLDELPEGVRPHVEPMLGRMTVPLPHAAGDAMYYVPNVGAVHEEIHKEIAKAHEEAHRAGREAESAARHAAREAEQVGRDAVSQAEEQAREIVRQAKEKAREARRAAEATAREQAGAAIEHGRAWAGQQFDDKLDEVDRRLEELRGMLNSLRESRKASAPEKPEPEKQ